MKKILVLLLTGILLVACGSSGATEVQQEEEVKAEPVSEEIVIEEVPEEEPVFVEEDIALAKEMIEFIQQKEDEFVEEANKEFDKTRDSYEEYNNFLLGTTADDEIRNDFQKLSNDMILNPFLDKYGQHVIEQSKRNFMYLVNVRAYSDDGKRLPLSKFEITPSYQHFNLEEPIIEYHEQYNVHELTFPVSENTELFVTEKETDNTVHDEFTFYKTEDGDLIVGKFSSLKFNAHVDFEDDPEDVREDLQELPPLQ